MGASSVGPTCGSVLAACPKRCKLAIRRSAREGRNPDAAGRSPRGGQCETGHNSPLFRVIDSRIEALNAVGALRCERDKARSWGDAAGLRDLDWNWQSATADMIPDRDLLEPGFADLFGALSLGRPIRNGSRKSAALAGNVLQGADSGPPRVWQAGPIHTAFPTDKPTVLLAPTLGAIPSDDLFGARGRPGWPVRPQRAQRAGGTGAELMPWRLRSDVSVAGAPGLAKALRPDVRTQIDNASKESRRNR